MSRGEPPEDPWRIDPAGPDPDPDRPGESGADGGGPPSGPPRGLASKGVKSASRWYSILVGGAFLAVIAVAVINGFGSDTPNTLGDEDNADAPLVEFALPDARGDAEGDANIAQDDCERARIPCRPNDVRTPACEVDTDGALRVCDYFDKPLAISFWFTRGGDCTPTQDAFDLVARRYRDQVNFLSINVRDERDLVREIIDERGWEVPVGYDADGAVANLYGVAVCPTIALAAPGGILLRTRIGELSVEAFDEMIADLVRKSRRREASSH